MSSACASSISCVKPLLFPGFVHFSCKRSGALSKDHAEINRFGFVSACESKHVGGFRMEVSPLIKELDQGGIFTQMR